jgi:hypothetical protein
VCFSPEEDCTAFAVDAIDRAEQQILVGAYSLTTGSSLDFGERANRQDRPVKSMRSLIGARSR